MRRFLFISARRVINAFVLSVSLAGVTCVAAESPERRSLVERGIISDGGRQLLQLDIEEVTDADLAALTSDDLLKLREASFNGGVSAAGLSSLGGATQLSSLYVGSVRLDENSCRQIAKMENLKELSITLFDRDEAQSSLTATDLANLRALHHLEDLELASTHLTDESLAMLASLPQLKRLKLGSSKLSDQGIRHIAKCPNLESLSYSCGEFTGAALDALAESTKLRSVELVGSNLDRAAFIALRKIKSLRELTLLGEGVVTDEIAEEIGNLTQLEELNCRGKRLADCTDNSLAAISRLSNLQKLSIARCRVTDVGVRHMARCTRLKELSIGKPRVDVTDDSLRLLSELPHIKKLVLECDIGKVTDQGLAHLKESKTLEFVAVTSDGVTEAGAMSLLEGKQLKHVGVDGAQISDSCRETLDRVSYHRGRAAQQ